MAVVSISPDFFTKPAGEQRQDAVHELLHVHLAPLDWSQYDLAEHVGVKAKRISLATWEQRSERACDDLARVIAPTLPLPPWKAR